MKLIGRVVSVGGYGYRGMADQRPVVVQNSEIGPTTITYPRNLVIAPC